MRLMEVDCLKTDFINEMQWNYIKNSDIFKRNNVKGPPSSPGKEHKEHWHLTKKDVIEAAAATPTPPPHTHPLKLWKRAPKEKRRVLYRFYFLMWVLISSKLISYWILWHFVLNICICSLNTVIIVLYYIVSILHFALVILLKDLIRVLAWEVKLLWSCR